MIILLICIFALYIVIDKKITMYNRKKVKFIIHISGTRGKSSLVRMLDAVFREHGYRTFSKITGTVPVIINTDGNEVSFKRWVPSVIEQKRVLKMAAKSKAEVLIVECMALRPEAQRYSESIFNADILVISNVRTDHLEVMGYELEEIADTLFCAADKMKTIITSDKYLYERYKSDYKNLIIADSYENIQDEIIDNTNIVFQVAKYCGISDKEIKKGIVNTTKDVGTTRMVRFNENFILCAFSVNDIESTDLLYSMYNPTKRNIILFNDRSDRPMRSNLMLRWILEMNPELILLEGDNIIKNKKFLISKGFLGEVESLKNFRSNGELIFGVGNFKGIHKRLGVDEYV